MPATTTDGRYRSVLIDLHEEQDAKGRVLSATFAITQPDSPLHETLWTYRFLQIGTPGSLGLRTFAGLLSCIGITITPGEMNIEHAELRGARVGLFLRRGSIAGFWPVSWDTA